MDAVAEHFDRLELSFFKSCLEKLKEHWQKCIDVEREYVEK